MNLAASDLFACVILSIVALTLQQDETAPTEWANGSFPNPQGDDNDKALCKVGSGLDNSYVCDPNEILTQEQRIELNEAIQGIMEHTDCPCRHLCGDPSTGYVVGIALLNKIADPAGYEEVTDRSRQEKNMHNLDKVKLFAYTLEKVLWGLGKCGEDVIIVYSREDNAIYTQTGDRARNKLTEGHIGYVSLKVMSKFQTGEVFEGLKKMLREYKALLKK